MKVAEVHWIDAYASTSGISGKEARKLEGAYTITVGFLLNENDAGVTLVMDTWPDEPDEAKVHTFIPWEMILHWYVYMGVPHAKTTRPKKS